jgi:type I restriction enzyme R subunit
MTKVGQIEKRTQARVLKLFRTTLGYDYLGNWIDREDNRDTGKVLPDLEGGGRAEQPVGPGLDATLQ